MPTGQFPVDAVPGKLLRTQVFNSIWNIPAATHRSKTPAGGISNCHLPRALAQTDPSPEDRERVWARLWGSGAKGLAVCPSPLAGLLKAGPDQKLDKLPRNMAYLACIMTYLTNVWLNLDSGVYSMSWISKMNSGMFQAIFKFEIMPLYYSLKTVFLPPLLGGGEIVYKSFKLSFP